MGASKGGVGRDQESLAFENKEFNSHIVFSHMLRILHSVDSPLSLSASLLVIDRRSLGLAFALYDNVIVSRELP